jgi:hypothetical protein
LCCVGFIFCSFGLPVSCVAGVSKLYILHCSFNYL